MHLDIISMCHAVYALGLYIQCFIKKRGSTIVIMTLENLDGF